MDWKKEKISFFLSIGLGPLREEGRVKREEKEGMSEEGRGNRETLTLYYSQLHYFNDNES